MKHNLLHLLCLAFLLSGCNQQKKPQTIAIVPDSLSSTSVEMILDSIDSSGTGYVYIYHYFAKNTEIKHLRKVRDSVLTGVRLKLKLDKHIARAEIISEHLKDEIMLNFYGGQIDLKRDVFVYAKPPNPCPTLPIDTVKGGSSCVYGAEVLSYYTENPEDNLNVAVNGKKIEIHHASYDTLTRIRTFELSKQIQGKRGEAIDLKMEVTRKNNRIELQYTEKIR